MAPGNLVQYRSRIETDPEPESVPKCHHGWGRTGIVISISDWHLGEACLPGESVTFMDGEGKIIEACARDLKVIS